MNQPHTLVGRVAELAALEEALAAAILGRGCAVVLSGEPGIGKSRLAGELSDRAERRGAKVVWARCASDAEAPAYWPFVQLLRSLHPAPDEEALVQRFGPGARDALALMRDAGAASFHTEKAEPADPALSSPAAPQRFRLFDTITSMLLAAASERPLVLVLDDIHAADPGCLQLLVFLVRSLRGARLLVVSTMRSAEARRTDLAPILLGTLAREALALQVDGWTGDEVRAYLRQSGARSNELAEAVHRASAGNPFFVGEITRLLRPEQDPDALPVPDHVRQAVLARLALLDADVAALLRAAAVVGIAFDPRSVAAVAGVDEERAAWGLGHGAEAGFVERGPDRTWMFRHEISRDVLYGSLEPAERRRGHQAAAAAASSGHASRGREVVAHHLLCALPDGDLFSALEVVRQVATSSASAMAYERAASWMVRGLHALAEHGKGDRACEELRGEMLLALGDAQWSLGQFEESRAAFEEAAAIATACGDRRLLARAALGAGGRQQRAHVQFDAGLVDLLERALADCDDPLLTARLNARLAYALYAAPGSRGRRHALASEAVAAVDGGADAATRRAVLADHRWALWGPDELDARRAMSGELLAAALRDRDREGALVEYGWQVVDGLEAGDRAAVDRAFAAYRSGTNELRLPWYQWYATRLACLLAQVEGRLEDAEKLAAEALAAGQRAGHPDAALAFGSQLLAIRLAQDRVLEIEGAVEDQVSRYPDVLLWQRLLARIRAAHGSQVEAQAEIARARSGALVDAPGDFLHLPSLAILADLVSAAGDGPAASRTYEALRPWAGRQVVLGFGMGFLGCVDQYLGELAEVGGRLCEARSHFESAFAQAEKLGAGRWAARATASLRRLAATPAVSAAIASSSLTVPAARAVLRADGDGWSGEFAGTSFRVGALRGIVYLRALLAEPEREFHVLDLAALRSPGAQRQGKGTDDAIADRADTGDSGPLLDDRAKRAYRSRLAELREDLDEATMLADNGRIALVRAEIESLEDELSRAIGLGGRDRRGNAAAERARVSVAKRIRGALERLGDQSPELQRYLEATIRTGIFCAYRPAPGRRVDWPL
jgi:hypothetical protein